MNTNCTFVVVTGAVNGMTSAPLVLPATLPPGIFCQAPPSQYCRAKFASGATPVAPEYRCALPSLFVNCKLISKVLLPTSVVSHAEAAFTRPSEASKGQLPYVLAVVNVGFLRARLIEKSVPKG